MSRIGKIPVEIPESVEVAISGNKLNVSGPKGELLYTFNPKVKLEQKENKVIVSVKDKAKDAQKLYGLSRTLVANMITGVSEGFEKELEFIGVGYRAKTEGDILTLNLGYSHPIKYKIAKGIEVKVTKNVISVSGCDKQLVGQTAAEIRSLRKPEPYKGKGIKYKGEHIRRKAGKVAAKVE